MYEDDGDTLNIYRQSVDLVKCADQAEHYSCSRLRKDPLKKGEVKNTLQLNQLCNDIIIHIELCK